jgi:protein-S-isoprenylcysteine O-methyltransferase Ste14
MSPSQLRNTLHWLTAAVWWYQIFWASKIFKRLESGLPPWLPLFPLTWAGMFFAVFWSPLEPRLVIPGVLCHVVSVVVFEWARQTIRGKFFSYAQSDDTPEFLLTSGPYAYIRNPFYSSYIISYIGAVLLFPNFLTAALASGLILFFVVTAIKEERKFAVSPLAEQYEAYRQRTGRFIPRLKL